MAETVFQIIRDVVKDKTSYYKEIDYFPDINFGGIDLSELNFDNRYVQYVLDSVQRGSGNFADLIPGITRIPGIDRSNLEIDLRGVKNAGAGFISGMMGRYLPDFQGKDSILENLSGRAIDILLDDENRDLIARGFGASEGPERRRIQNELMNSAFNDFVDEYANDPSFQNMSYAVAGRFLGCSQQQGRDFMEFILGNNPTERSTNLKTILRPILPLIDENTGEYKMPTRDDFQPMLNLFAQRFEQDPERAYTLLRDMALEERDGKLQLRENAHPSVKAMYDRVIAQIPQEVREVIPEGELLTYADQVMRATIKAEGGPKAIADLIRNPESREAQEAVARVAGPQVAIAMLENPRALDYYNGLRDKIYEQDENGGLKLRDGVDPRIKGVIEQIEARIPQDIRDRLPEGARRALTDTFIQGVLGDEAKRRLLVDYLKDPDNPEKQQAVWSAGRQTLIGSLTTSQDARPLATIIQTNLGQVRGADGKPILSQDDIGRLTDFALRNRGQAGELLQHLVPERMSDTAQLSPDFIYRQLQQMLKPENGVSPEFRREVAEMIGNLDIVRGMRDKLPDSIKGIVTPELMTDIALDVMKNKNYEQAQTLIGHIQSGDMTKAYPMLRPHIIEGLVKNPERVEQMFQEQLVRTGMFTPEQAQAMVANFGLRDETKARAFLNGVLPEKYEDLTTENIASRGVTMFREQMLSDIREGNNTQVYRDLLARQLANNPLFKDNPALCGQMADAMTRPEGVALIERVWPRDATNPATLGATIQDNAMGVLSTPEGRGAVMTALSPELRQGIVSHILTTQGGLKPELVGGLSQFLAQDKQFGILLETLPSLNGKTPEEQQTILRAKLPEMLPRMLSSEEDRAQFSRAVSPIVNQGLGIGGNDPSRHSPFAIVAAHVASAKDKESLLNTPIVGADGKRYDNLPTYMAGDEFRSEIERMYKAGKLDEDLRDLFTKTSANEWRNMFESVIEQNTDFATFRQRLLTNPSELKIDATKTHGDAYRGWANLWTGITVNGAQMFFRGMENINLPQFDMSAITNRPQQSASDARVADIPERRDN